MKKSLIALAVAGALAVPAIASADATLYGVVAVDGVFKNDTSADIQVDDAVIGLKGTVDVGMEGVTGFFNIRTELSGDADGENGINGVKGQVTTDIALVGLTGSFGTVQAGAMNNPVDAVESLDRATDSYSQGKWFVSPDDLSSSIAYVSPAIGGFTGYAGLVVDGGQADTATVKDKDLDGYLVGFNYGIGGFTADVGYWDFDSEGRLGDDVGGDYDYIGVSLDYAISDVWSVTANWAESNIKDTGTDVERELMGLGTKYKVGNTTLGLNYIDFDEKDNGLKGDLTGDEWSVTASHALSNRAKVYASYSDADLDTGSVAGERVLNVGYSLSF